MYVVSRLFWNQKNFFFWKALKSRDPTLEQAHSGVQGNLNRPWVNDYNIPNRKKNSEERGQGGRQTAPFSRRPAVWEVGFETSSSSCHEFSPSTASLWLPGKIPGLETAAVCGQTDDQIQTWDHCCMYSNIEYIYERWEYLHAGRHASVWNPSDHAHHPCVCL